MKRAVRTIYRKLKRDETKWTHNDTTYATKLGKMFTENCWTMSMIRQTATAAAEKIQIHDRQWKSCALVYLPMEGQRSKRLQCPNSLGKIDPDVVRTLIVALKTKTKRAYFNLDLDNQLFVAFDNWYNLREKADLGLWNLTKYTEHSREHLSIASWVGAI